MDAGMEEMGFGDCINGHTLCLNHFTKSEPPMAEWQAFMVREMWSDERKAKIRAMNPEEFAEFFTEEQRDDYGYTVKAGGSGCPICSLEHISDSVLLAYVLGKADREKLATGLRERFGSLVELKEYIEEKKGIRQ
jgi:hypothetical protein